MLATTVWPWAALILLGALHGMNPGMGWLFAVALGLQEGSGRAVWRALPPLMAGHALAVAAAVGLALALGPIIDPADLRWLVGAALFGTGVFHLVRHRHPRFGGMRVGARDLVIWSFLMASAHGAGLMAVPFVPTTGTTVAVAHAGPTAGAHDHAAHGRALPGHGAHDANGRVSPAGAGPGAGWLAVLATLVHTAGYLVVTGGIAAVVYYRLGLRLLRKAWIDLDRIWAGALILTALLVILP